MDETRRQELEGVIAGMKEAMTRSDRPAEDSVPADEAREDRLALARRIGRLYLSFSRMLLKRLGEEEGRAAILEAMRDYSLHCAKARKKGMVDLPRRGVHAQQEVVQVDGEPRLRCHGCGIQQEFAAQDDEKLGALYCYVDACSYLLTMPNVKMFHTKMEPLGDAYCEFDFGIVSDEDMKLVLEEGRDYQGLDPIIKEGTEGRLLKA